MRGQADEILTMSKFYNDCGDLRGAYSCIDFPVFFDKKSLKGIRNKNLHQCIKYKLI